MIDLDAMGKDPWPTWPVDKNELRMLVEENEKLRERRADWRAAMTENHDLWRENERLRAALREIVEECRNNPIVIDRMIDRIEETACAALGEEKADG
jgi:regulator of replication initiation timing